MDKAVVRGESALQELWPIVAPMLERAVAWADGELTVEDVGLGIALGRYQLWLVTDGQTIDAAAITELVQYHRKKAVRVVLLAGMHMVEWSGLLDEAIVSFARSEGATRIEAVGRRGLGKRLKEHGFDSTYAVYLKEVPDE